MKLLVAGGGTGGHVFPGIAVVEALQLLEHTEVMWIGTGRPIEASAVKPKGWEYHVLEVKPLKGANIAQTALSLMSQPYFLLKAARLLRAFKPDVALGVGGYVSGTVIMAAKLLGICSALHEQNVVPGLSNKLASRFADKIFVSFEESRRFFAADKVELTGNPVRAAFVEYAKKIRQQGNLFKKYGQSESPFRLLILGGSQGASSLNRLVCSAACMLSKSGCRLEVMHQSGQADANKIQTLYNESAVKAETKPFIEDVLTEYIKADLVICRAGAGTVFELTATASPAILIPYPYAGAHQEANARALSDKGAAIMCKEDEIGAVRLATEIQGLMEDKLRLQKMSESSFSLARPDAAREIAQRLLRL